MGKSIVLTEFMKLCSYYKPSVYYASVLVLQYNLAITSQRSKWKYSDFLTPWTTVLTAGGISTQPCEDRAGVQFHCHPKVNSVKNSQHSANINPNFFLLLKIYLVASLYI